MQVKAAAEGLDSRQRGWRRSGLLSGSLSRAREEATAQADSISNLRYVALPCPALRCVALRGVARMQVIAGPARAARGKRAKKQEWANEWVCEWDGGAAPDVVCKCSTWGIIMEHHPTVVGCYYSARFHGKLVTCGMLYVGQYSTSTLILALPGLGRRPPITGNATSTRTPKHQPGLFYHRRRRET